MKKTSELARLNYGELKKSHFKRRLMTIKNIMFVVAKIMENHIGLDNGIEAGELFKKIYRVNRKPDFVDDFRWDYVRKAMHRLRQQTKLFICNAKSDYGGYIYYVPTSPDEAQHYVDRLEGNIKRMRVMQKKAMQSVKKRWYELNWIDESKELTAMEESYGEQTKKLLSGAKNGKR